MASMPDPAHRAEHHPSFASTLRLALSLKGQPIQLYTFEKSEVTVGRDPGCDVWVDNPGVSRLHFRIERADTGEFRVVDQGSANGTWLNDHPVQVASLRDGDAIHFAKYSLEVRVDQLVGGRSTMRAPEHRAEEGATVMLKPSEVRQLMAEPAPRASGNGARAGAPAKIVELPKEHAAAPHETPAARAWWVWLGVGLVVAAAVAAWFATR
jgi:pSer/pThr/pTyr-binding forkhead associated (FHA) protein